MAVRGRGVPQTLVTGLQRTALIHQAQRLPFSLQSRVDKTGFKCRMRRKGLEGDEYAVTDAPESCDRMGGSAEEPRKMAPEP